MGRTIEQIINMAYDLNEETTTSARYSAGQSVVWANIIYRELCRDCKVVAGDGTLQVSKGVREYALPAGAVSLERVECDNGIRYTLEKINFKEILNYEGSPYRYYLRGATKIGVDPLPDQAYTLTWYGYMGPATDIDLEEEPQYLPDDWRYLIAYGLLVMWNTIDKGMDSSEAMKWKAMFEEGKQKLFAYLQGGNSSDFDPGVM